MQSRHAKFAPSFIKPCAPMTHLKTYLLWPVLFISQTIALALLSWHLLAQFHFAYPLGYQLLDLHTHIAEFAPLNRHKEDFEFVSQHEHWRLFGEISDAVQNSGAGLGDIHYTLANGQRTPLMHEAEIIHLQDVANLIDVFYTVGLGCWLLWLLCLAIAYWKKLTLPAPKKILIGFLGGLAITALVIISWGAKEVFYWLHVQIFPKDHQWFFFYQDSLMTTLMKAPDIFAFISLLLLLLLVGFWLAGFWGMKLLLAPPKQPTPHKSNPQKTRGNNKK